MNRLIHLLLWILICLTLILTTGCWSRKEIEDLTVGVGLGLDVGNESRFEREIDEQGAHYPKEKLITATIQIVPPIGGKSDTQGGDKSPSPQKAYLNEQLTGDSLFQIFRQFSVRRDRPIVGHHLKVIVISRELAKKYSLEQVLDFLFRANEVRPSCLVVISHRSALEALSSREPGEIPAFYLLGLTDNQFRSNKILPPMSLIKLESKMEDGQSFILQNVVTAQSEHKFSGAAIIKGKTRKWIGELSQYDVEGLSWITGYVKGGALKAYASHNGYSISYEPKQTQSRIIPKIQNGALSFHIKISTEGRLIEDWSFPEISASQEYLDEMEEDFKKEMQKQINQVLNKMQHVYGVDVGGFGEHVRIKYPKFWKQVEEKWDETFATLSITYDIDIKITDYGASID